MTFPYYHLYQEAITARNGLILATATVTLVGLNIIWLTARLKPAWRSIVLWTIGVGGFYAALALLSLWDLARAAGH